MPNSCMSPCKLAVAAAILCVVLYIDAADGDCSRVTTFNAALLPRIPKYAERREVIPQAIIDENADFICLQEIWFEQDVHKVIEETKNLYPYHYSALHKGLSNGPQATKRRFWFSETPCSIQDAWYFLTRIFPCGIASGCLPLFSQDFALGFNCATSRCGNYFNSTRIRPECITCITLTATTISNLLGECIPEFRGRDNRLNDPGLVILSKRPMSNVVYESFFPDNRMTLPRGYIKADVDGLPPILCTHLTALFPVYFEYDLSFGNYLAQQREEIEIIGGVYGTQRHILTGDLNTGPEVSAAGERNVQGEGPENYAALINQGYSAPYMTQDARCTYCRENGLVRNTSDSNAIDQVLFMSDTSSVVAQRVLDETVGDGLPLSDHYGVRATICDNVP